MESFVKEINGLLYHRFHLGPAENNEKTLSGLIRCYQDVFSEPPWNEWKKCQICGKHWGIDEKNYVEQDLKLKHCGASVVDFWPHDEVLNDIREELSQKGAFCFLVKNNEGDIIGFYWGYLIELEKLEKKLNIELMLESRDKKLIVAYLDDMGVLNQYRGLKIASRLFNLGEIEFRNQGVSYQIGRVKKSPEPSVTFLWFTNSLNFKIIAEYCPKEDGRVVLGRKV